MKISQVIQEALPISVAKKYVQAWDPSIHKQVFEREPRKDKNAYRVYIPFQQETDSKINIPENLLSYLQGAIPNKPYSTDADNYMQGLAFEVANPTRKLGIGKMLARSEGSEKDPARKSELQALKKSFDADPQRAATKTPDKLIVISRHPYDVAGMSTDRGWKSCMNLVDGINRHYVLRDVKKGSIVAYLINADDLNVNRPLARILIKPYQEKGNPTNLAMMGDAVYGTAPARFKTQVDAWVNAKYNADKSGLFCLAAGLYKDVIPRQMRLMNDDAFAQAPRAQIVQMARNDDEMWPRVARLRSDADEIFWQVAEKGDPRAAHMIQNISLDRFKQAFKKGASVLAHLHTQTPEIVIHALEKRPDAVVYVRNRTPAQQALVKKMLAKNPDLIQRVHAPTPDQVQYAVGKDDWLLSWAMEEHPDMLTEDQVTKWIMRAAENQALDNEHMMWIRKHYPQLLTDPKIFEWLAEHQPELLWNNGKLTDADVQRMVRRAHIDTGWHTSWWETHVPEVIARLKQIPTDQMDPDLIPVLSRKMPDLLGAFPDADMDMLKSLVKKRPHMIQHWQNPAPELVYVALLHDDDNDLEDGFQDARYESVWAALIKKHADNIARLRTPSPSLLKLAAQHPELRRWAARWILDKNPDVATQVRVLKKYPDLISDIRKPSLAAQMAAVNADPDAYEDIRPRDRHPAVKAYIQAYRKEMRKPE